MKFLIALLAAGSLVSSFTSCERHSWEGSTKKLFEDHHGTHPEKSDADADNQVKPQ